MQNKESKFLSKEKKELQISLQKDSRSVSHRDLKDHFDNKYLLNSTNSNVLFNFANVQPKLRVSQPGDPYEHEADRVAEQVMNMSSFFQRSKQVPTIDNGKEIF
jgi:hypothetical protein